MANRGETETESQIRTETDSQIHTETQTRTETQTFNDGIVGSVVHEPSGLEPFEPGGASSPVDSSLGGH